MEMVRTKGDLSAARALSVLWLDYGECVSMFSKCYATCSAKGSLKVSVCSMCRSKHCVCEKSCRIP